MQSPFDGAEVRRYVTFCAVAPNEKAVAELDAWTVPGERVQVRDREVHWWLTKPTNEAKLTIARFEKLVGVTTTRDLKVVRELANRWGA